MPKAVDYWGQAKGIDLAFDLIEIPGADIFGVPMGQHLARSPAAFEGTAQVEAVAEPDDLYPPG